MERFKIFADFDGVLAEFRKVGPDVYTAAGYSRTLKPFENIIRALHMFNAMGLAEIFLCSAVMPYEHVIGDKDFWLDEHMPWLDKAHRIYLPYGQNKAVAIRNATGNDPRVGDIFLDDYTPNLIDLDATDITPVKVLNGINDTRKTWTGARISVASKPEALFISLYGISVATRMAEMPVGLAA